MAQSSETTTSGSGVGLGVLDLIQGVVEACSVPAGDRGVDGWMDLIAEVTAGMSALAAARDAAIVRLAALEEIVTEDGVIGVQVNGLGSVCIDAGAMVSTATGTSARFGDELVRQAVTRVVRVPAVQEAMVEGVLDDYKARCIAGELEDVPVELARTVVDVLAPELRERSGPALRRRTRDILFRLAPELLKERLRQSRNAVSVRRWVGEPGTDNWSAVFPSERSARAWAAVDALAHRYREEDTYPTLEQARAYALLDLVDGNATVETVLQLTVAADALVEATGCEPVTEARPPRRARPSAQALSGVAGPRPPVRRGSVQDPGQGDEPDPIAKESERHAEESERHAEGPERHAKEPERPDGGRAGHGGEPGRHASEPDGCETSRPLEQDAGDPVFIAVSGAGGSDARWMPLSALPAVPVSTVPVSTSPASTLPIPVEPTSTAPVPAAPASTVPVTVPGSPRVVGPTGSWARPRGRDPGPTVRFAHPITGALVDVDDELSSDGYRPAKRLIALIRQRDGRCRFPGCVIAARFCDIDHVIPWPHGPTAAGNLMCLCRRHHRIKQRLRWRVRMRPDGTVIWSAPNGTTVTTDPVDHMRAGEVRVSALPPVTAAQIDRLREEEELLDLYDAVREARRTEPQRRAAAEAAAEAEFIERASRAHLDAADAVATAIVAGARGGTGIEVGFAEQVAAQVRAGAALRPPPSTGELRRRFRVQREQERRRERESRRGVPSRALHARDESPPKRDQRGHHDWCFDPAKGLGASSAVYRPDRRWRRTIRRHQRRREANGGAPF